MTDLTINLNGFIQVNQIKIIQSEQMDNKSPIQSIQFEYKLPNKMNHDINSLLNYYYEDGLLHIETADIYTDLINKIQNTNHYIFIYKEKTNKFKQIIKNLFKSKTLTNSSSLSSAPLVVKEYQEAEKQMNTNLFTLHPSKTSSKNNLVELDIVIVMDNTTELDNLNIQLNGFCCSHCLPIIQDNNNVNLNYDIKSIHHCNFINQENEKTLNYNHIHVTHNGNGNIKFKNIQANDFQLNIKGVGHFTIQDITADKIKIKTNGTGNLTCKNIKTNQYNIYANGIGKNTIKQLTASKLKVELCGVGNIIMEKVYSSESKIINKSFGKVKVLSGSLGLTNIQRNDFFPDNVILDGTVLYRNEK